MTEICSYYIWNINNFANDEFMLIHTSMLDVQDSSESLKRQEVGPIYVSPIYRYHLNVTCHRKLLRRDQKTENPTENAKILDQYTVRIF